MERKKIHDILDTKEKERMSIKRCIEFQNKDENRTTILAFSGGKDSVVAYMMAAKSGIKFIPMYSPTSVDPPELINYIKKEFNPWVKSKGYPEVVFKKYKAELEEKSKIIKQIEISENSMLVRDVAKIASKNGIKIGEKKLYNILREWGLIFKNDTTPKQIYIDRGYFEVTEGTKEIKNKTLLYKTTKVTGKGQLYIIKRLLKEFK